ncbi:MAG: hypothetical protein KKD31_04550, partial [Bacteroidetes bacterium]|nr:hypothetical protein [Bacteroidota bacterium]
MKTIRKILPTLLSLALLFANQISESQTQICSGDSLRLRLDSFRGNIQWQESADSLIWSDISGASYQPYIVIPNTTKFFRAVVTDGNCDPIYSPVQKVMVTTRQAPTAAVHISTLNAIIWKWNAVAGANGYKWNTVDDYGSSENLGTDTFRIESNLNCDSTYIRYVWAYNDCGNSVSSTLTQSTALCPANNCGVINDSRDGQSYQTVVIGAQCWMAENLRFLPSVHTNTDFEVQGNNSQPAYGVYGYNGSSLDTAQGKASYAIYGALYNWWAATQGEGDCNGSGAPPNDDCTVPVQGICPTGWHLPSHYEWTTLERAVCSINCTT